MPIKPAFRNLDLSQIWDAITAGGGGGGGTYSEDLFKLFDGQTNPSNYNGFYPIALQDIRINTQTLSDLLNGSADPVNYGFYPQVLLNIDNNTAAISQLNAIFQGTATPINVDGYFWAQIYAINQGVTYLDYLFEGTKNPDNLSGFYPSHVIHDSDTLDGIYGTALKIEAHTDHQMLAVDVQTFGTGISSSVSYYTGTNFSTPAAAAADAVNYMNTKSGSYIVQSLTFTDRGGANGHSYVLTYKSIL